RPPDAPRRDRHLRRRRRTRRERRLLPRPPLRPPVRRTDAAAVRGRRAHAADRGGHGRDRHALREARFMTLAPSRPPTAARQLSRRARHRPAHGRGGLPCLLRRSSVTPSPARGSVALPATTTAISSAGGTTPRTAMRSR